MQQSLGNGHLHRGEALQTGTAPGVHLLGDARPQGIIAGIRYRSLNRHYRSIVAASEQSVLVFGASRERSAGNNREPSGSRSSRQAKGSNSVTMATLPSASSAVITP